VNNVLRHSGCAKAVIDLVVESGWLVLTVSDDGKGVDLQEAEAGHGFSSMRRRAESFGGQLEIISPNGSGTTVRLTVPIGRPLFKEATRLSAAARKAGKGPS
jgi:signal transduction histidine kinase